MGCFPPAFIPDEQQRPKHSWRVSILPFLDQAPLYNTYRFDEPWDGPNNAKLAEQIPPAFRCPSYVRYHARHNLETAHRKLLTNYVAIVEADAIFCGARATTYRDVTDGTSSTILVAEARHHAVHWMQPADASANEVIVDLQSASGEHHGNHVGGLHVLLADGSVSFLSSATAVSVVRALVTRNGSERVGDF